MVKFTLYVCVSYFFVQIENEYEPESKAFGTAGYAYMTWAAHMAVSMDTGVPWVMCKEFDAPDPVVRKLVFLWHEGCFVSHRYLFPIFFPFCLPFIILFCLYGILISALANLH